MCAQETPIELRQSAVTEMSSKLSESDQRYKSLGFERTAGGVLLNDPRVELELKRRLRRQSLVNCHFQSVSIGGVRRMDENGSPVE